MIYDLMFVIQFFFTVVTGLYFYKLLKGQNANKGIIEKDSRRELVRLEKLRSKKLNVPLTEKTRPASVSDIIGQDDAIKALRTVLCGPYPQHVIIYGPPGVGKTAAARVILEEAKNMECSPFKADAPFIEIDAGTLRFDERGIADPLIGSVHDPIYQGAGAYGVAGVPQPKPGAVTKAHGGILFIDEIGELHPTHLNKLLKVLEDRKVFFESAYYNREIANIPPHIHDIFQNGLPADFRLVSATTRPAESIPEAIRSRCVEIYFKALSPAEISIITEKACLRSGFEIDRKGVELISQFATNGREAVNILQIAESAASLENRKNVTVKDVEWVINFGNYSPRIEKKLTRKGVVGRVNGLAVIGHLGGAVLPIEVFASKAKGFSGVSGVSGGISRRGSLNITGINEYEEIAHGGTTMKRRSMARSSVDNVITVLKNIFHMDVSDLDLHINFPGASLVDGPSAGLAIACGVYSAVYNIPVPGDMALTGEISIQGDVLPVGGVPAKIEAAIKAGASRVLIPMANNQEIFSQYGDKIVPVSRLEDVINIVFNNEKNNLLNAYSGVIMSKL